MDLVKRNLAPNRTASIQLYQRGTNTAVGSAIAGSSVGYDYTFPNVPSGDFDYELIGFTADPSSRRALRVTATAIYEAANWWEIDTSVSGGVPIVPSPIAGLCNVTIAATDNDGPIEGAVASATLEGKYNTLDSWVVSRSITSATTDANGVCVLRLIQFSQFTSGGIYRIKVSDPGGKVMCDKSIPIPEESAINLEDI